jgi:hypothetical protein
LSADPTAKPGRGVAWGRADALAVGVLTAAWLATIAFVGVTGEFPLNDDWAFARTAWHLLETGRFERVPWVYATSFPNVVLGAGVSALFGPSFEALRASTLVVGWLGLLGGYVLCRQAGAGAGLALLAGAALGWNPVYLNLSFTFMSDVPFAALCTWTLVLGVAGLQQRSARALVGAAILGIAACATRQPGIALFLSLPLVLVVSTRGRWQRIAALGLTLSLAALGTLVAWGWLAGPDDPRAPFTLTRYVREYLASREAVYHAVTQLPVVLAYLGWFLAPLVWATRPTTATDRRLEWLALGLGSVMLLGLFASDRTMPLGLNIVHANGVGPVTLPSADALGEGPVVWWLGITALCALAASTLAVRIVRALWVRRNGLEGETAWLWLLLFPVVYVCALTVRAPFFDRYLVACLPPLLAFLIWAAGSEAAVSRSRRAVGWILAAVTATYAVAGTRDYLEHHRARWALLGPVLEEGVPPEEIRGGFEFGGLYLFGPEWRWVAGDLYRLAFVEQIEGFVPVSEQSYRTLFPPGRQRLALHRRTSPEPEAQ